jgi:chloramphenicol-sensitive protein RarD
MNRGIVYAVAAYLVWGLLPLYWKALQHVQAGEILANRILWSFLFLMALLVFKKEMGQVRLAFATPRTALVLLLAASLLSINWLVYIWSVNAGYIIETSLGYFINPLVNVLLGVIFLRERLRPFQWIPIGLASLGVLYMTFSYGQLPWIALVLAFSFGLYGLLKKRLPLGALPGLASETAMMAPLALLFIGYLALQGRDAFTHSGPVTVVLLVASGVVTALPMLLFNFAVRRINLSTIGLLQYMAPTMQFLIGVLVFQEPFTTARVVGFSLIWTALAIYTIESLAVHSRTRNSREVAAKHYSSTD